MEISVSDISAPLTCVAQAPVISLSHTMPLTPVPAGKALLVDIVTSVTPPPSSVRMAEPAQSTDGVSSHVIVLRALLGPR